MTEKPTDNPAHLATILDSVADGVYRRPGGNLSGYACPVAGKISTGVIA